MKKLFLLVIFATLLSGCSFTQEWTGFYYPNKDNIGDSSTWKIQSGFKTVGDCRGWANQTGVNRQNGGARKCVLWHTTAKKLTNNPYDL